MNRNDDQDPQSMEDALKDFVQKNRRLERGLDKVNVEDAWKSQMGPAIAKYTTGVKLMNKTLYVHLSSSVLREELAYGKGKIIKILNEELGKELIKKLILQ